MHEETEHDLTKTLRKVYVKGLELKTHYYQFLEGIQWEFFGQQKNPA